MLSTHICVLLWNSSYHAQTGNYEQTNNYDKLSIASQTASTKHCHEQSGTTLIKSGFHIHFTEGYHIYSNTSTCEKFQHVGINMLFY